MGTRVALGLRLQSGGGASGAPPSDVPDQPDPPAASYDIFWPGLGAMTGIDWPGQSEPLDWPGI